MKQGKVKQMNARNWHNTLKALPENCETLRKAIMEMLNV